MSSTIEPPQSTSMSKEHLDPRLRLSVSSPRPAASSSSSIQNPAPNSASSTSASPSPSLPSRPLPSSRSSSFSSHSAPSAPSQALFASGILAPTPRTSLWLPRLSPAPAQTPLPPASALQSPFQQQQQLPPPPSPAEYHGSLASTSSSPYTPGAVHQHDQHQHQQIGQVRPLQPFPLPTTPSSRSVTVLIRVLRGSRNIYIHPERRKGGFPSTVVWHAFLTLFSSSRLTETLQPWSSNRFFKLF